MEDYMAVLASFLLLPRYREIALTRLDIARRYGIDVSTW